LQGEFKVRHKVAVAVTAGALAGGLTVPSAASADTAQVVYAWGYNSYGQAGADPNVTGTNVLSPVPVHGAAANVTQLSGPNGPYKGRYVLSLRSDGTLLVWGIEGYGLRGDGIPRSTPLPLPTPVTPVPGVTKIAERVHRLGSRPVVTMPNVVGALRAAAVAQLQALGLSVQVLNVPDQRICDNVGYVESQTPPAGTAVAPGGHATIRGLRPAAGRLFLTAALNQARHRPAHARGTVPGASGW
jgi:hypothetical protein